MMRDWIWHEKFRDEIAILLFKYKDDDFRLLAFLYLVTANNCLAMVSSKFNLYNGSSLDFVTIFEQFFQFYSFLRTVLTTINQVGFDFWW